MFELLKLKAEIQADALNVKIENGRVHVFAMRKLPSEYQTSSVIFYDTDLTSSRMDVIEYIKLELADFIRKAPKSPEAI